MKKIGVIENYFYKVGVAVVVLTDDGLKKGEKIHIKGSTTDFKQIAESMQIDKQKVDSVEKGKKVGLKVDDRVREKDEVFRID